MSALPFDATEWLLGFLSNCMVDQGQVIFPPKLNQKMMELPKNQREAVLQEIESWVEQGLFKKTSDGRTVLTREGAAKVYG